MQSSPQPPDNLPVLDESSILIEPEITENVVHFVLALERVFRRLLAEGYQWKDGELVPPERHLRGERGRR